MMAFVFIHGFTVLAACALAGGLAFAPLVMRSAKADGVRALADLAQRKWLSFWLIANILCIVPAAYLRAPAWLLLVRVLLLVLLAEIIKRRRETGWLVLVLGAALLLTHSLTSRSAHLPDWVVATLADWVHLTLAAVWLGGVAMLWVGLRATTGDRPQTTEMQPLISSLSFIVDRFSRLALFCVLGLGMTGIAQAGIFIKGFEELWTTAYGRALSFKVFLFVVLIGFGGFHQQVVAPALRRAVLSSFKPGRSANQQFQSAGRARPARFFGDLLSCYEQMRRFRLSLLLEALVGAGLLLVVGLLISIPR